MAEGTAAQGAGPGRATRRPAPGQDVPMPAAAAAGEAGPSESVPARSEASPPAHDSPCVGLNRRARTCSQQCRTSTVSFLGVSGEALEASRHPSPDLAILLTLRPHPRRPPHHSRTPLALIKIHCGNDQMHLQSPSYECTTEAARVHVHARKPVDEAAGEVAIRLVVQRLVLEHDLTNATAGERKVEPV